MSSQALPLSNARAFGLKRLGASALLSALLVVPMASGLSAKTVPARTAHNGAGAGIAGRTSVYVPQRGPAAVVAQAAAPAATSAAANNTQDNGGGFPWWAWLIIVLVILAIIFAVMRSRQKPPIKTSSSSGRGDDPNIRTRS